MSTERKLRWERLDNAALIFPAAHRKNWANAFRIAFTMKDMIDPAVLQEAVNHLTPRFPFICARLRRSAFWYYLEELPEPPLVQAESYQPLVFMSKEEYRKSAVRILYYRNRFSVECFHVLTDGTGGMVFAKTLAAEYIRLRYGEEVPCENDIRDLHEEVPEEELKDAFKEYQGPVAAPRDPRDVYRMKGTREEGGYLHDTLGILDSTLLTSEAKKYGVTVTAYLGAVLLESLLELQAEDIPSRRKRKKVKIQVPVNLRQFYGSKTMRNFAAVANLGVDPRLGEYTFEELIKIVYHSMALIITEKNMKTIFTSNVVAELNPVVRVVPLPIKNLIMRLVYDAVGESVSCMSFSNLGNVKLPESMTKHLERVEFVVGAQATSPYNCGVCSFNGKAFLHLVRNTKEARLEEKFFHNLVKHGFHVKIETN